SLQLGFAMIPLIHFVSEKKSMEGFHIKIPLKIASWVITVVILGLNVQLVIGETQNWLEISDHPIYIWLFVIPLAIGAGVLLLYIISKPLATGRKANKRSLEPHITEASTKEFATPLRYDKIAIAVDFSKADKESIATALQLGGEKAE